MYQGLTFGLMVVVAVGTALYYFIQGSGQEGPQSSRERTTRYERPSPRYERPSPPPSASSKSESLLEQRRKRRRNMQNKEELEQDQCSICMESLYNKPIVTLTCGHDFHNKCLNKWFESKTMTCPLCRETVYE